MGRNDQANTPSAFGAKIAAGGAKTHTHRGAAVGRGAARHRPPVCVFFAPAGSLAPKCSQFVKNGYNLKWLQPQMATAPNGLSPKWLQPKMATAPNGYSSKR